MKETIILKSISPEIYPDLEIECLVINNDQITNYVTTIPEERKIVASKTAKVKARRGNPGEIIQTVLKVNVNGYEYILQEETTEVKLRDINDGSQKTDIVVKNINSTSNEEYVVKYVKFIEMYTSACTSGACHCGALACYTPNDEPRQLAQVDENIIILTAWGSKAICLAGSYIVTYNAEENDYNTLEKGAFESTYTVAEKPRKLIK